MRPALLVLIAAVLAMLSPNVAEAAPAEHQGWIGGIVEDTATGDALADALVILDCACLDHPRETLTDSRGIYRFAGLPPGEYELQVLIDDKQVTSATTLPEGERRRVDLSVEIEAAPIEREIVLISELPRSAYRCVYTISQGCICGPPWPATRQTFELGKSLFDGGGRRELEGGPEVTRWLH